MRSVEVSSKTDFFDSYGIDGCLAAYLSTMHTFLNRYKFFSFADSSSICEYLETLGLTSLDARKLVKDFTQKSTKSVSKIVDLKFLTSWLEEEMEHVRIHQP